MIIVDERRKPIDPANPLNKRTINAGVWVYPFLNKGDVHWSAGAVVVRWDDHRVEPSQPVIDVNVSFANSPLTIHKAAKLSTALALAQVIATAPDEQAVTDLIKDYV